MTQEDKQLLLVDLCARLPYNVVINCTEEDDEKTNFNCFLAPDMIKDIKSETAYWIIKPYLRPMSSMTYNESNYYNIYIEELSLRPNMINAEKLIAWLLKNHFDYHNLIPMGLALEAPEDIYKS